MEKTKVPAKVKPEPAIIAPAPSPASESATSPKPATAAPALDKIVSEKVADSQNSAVKSPIENSNVNLSASAGRASNDPREVKRRELAEKADRN